MNSQAAPMPTTTPRSPPIAPSTIPVDERIRNRIDLLPPILATIASVRCCWRALTAKAAPASSTTSNAPKAPSIPPMNRICWSAEDGDGPG